MLASPQSQGVGPCSGTHCSKQSVVTHVNEVCKQNSWPVGAHVLVQNDKGEWCYCTCSCLATGSLVAVDASQTQTIESFAIGGPIYATDTDFNWTQIKVAEVIGTDQIGQPNTVFIRFAAGSLIVTSDHLFLVDDNGRNALLTADKLDPSDKLVGPGGNAVDIIEVQTGDYFGAFHNVSTDAATDPSTNPNGHLLNTGGVISGDYALQTFWAGGALDEALLHSGIHDRPVVGSIEYMLRNPSSDPTPEAISAAEAVGVTFSDDPESLAPGVFVVRSEIGDEDDDVAAAMPMGFVPLHRVGALESLPAYKFSDVQRQALGEYLATFFGAFYPEIDFRVDWWRRNVNVLAHPAEGALKPRVIITGGMLRVKMLDIGSLSLAMSFAIASINAEGEDSHVAAECDYGGAASVMRNVWWEMDYVTKIEAAVEELQPFFSFIPLHFGRKDGPNYPAGSCRIETYQNAMTLTGIPACAKDVT